LGPWQPPKYYTGSPFPVTRSWQRFHSKKCKDTARAEAIRKADEINRLSKQAASIHQSLGNLISETAVLHGHITCDLEAAFKGSAVLSKKIADA